MPALGHHLDGDFNSENSQNKLVHDRQSVNKIRTEAWLELVRLQAHQHASNDDEADDCCLKVHVIPGLPSTHSQPV